MRFIEIIVEEIGTSWIDEYAVRVEGEKSYSSDFNYNFVDESGEWVDGDYSERVITDKPDSKGIYSVTREEFEQFVKENPNFMENLSLRRKEAMEQLTELTKELTVSVNKAYELASAVGIEFEPDFGKAGALMSTNDPRWNSSYC